MWPHLYDPRRFVNAHYVGMYASFLAVQILLKLTQIGVIRLVLSTNDAYAASSAAEASTSLIAQQVASPQTYVVYRIDAESMILRITNDDLSRLRWLPECNSISAIDTGTTRMLSTCL